MAKQIDIEQARDMVAAVGIGGARQAFHDTFDLNIIQAITEDLSRRADEFNRLQRALRGKRTASRPPDQDSGDRAV